MSDPFAPVPGPAVSGPPCPSCGRPLATGTGQYDDSGMLVCASCAAAPAIHQAQAESTRKTQSMFIGALSSIGIALMSFCVQHKVFFFVFPILAMVSGVSIFLACVRHDDAKTLLGWRYAPTLIASALGALIGLASLALALFVRLIAN